MYRITARITNRMNGTYRFSTGVPTFYIGDDQMATSASDAAIIARRMLSELVRQDMSMGAEIHGEAVDVENPDDYAAL